MNGVFVKDEDLGPLAEYLVDNAKRRPPDHLIVEWFAGETPSAASYRGARQHLGFRFNIFDHVGATSTLRAQHSAPMPRCFDDLAVPVVFPVEAFSAKRCPANDFTPCDGMESKPMLDFGILRRSARGKTH